MVVLIAVLAPSRCPYGGVYENILLEDSLPE